MSVADLKPYLAEHWPRIREDLLADRYQPQAVRGVEIPKPGGGMRQLGIPTAVDRLIQQALHQVLMPLFDPGFSPHTEVRNYRPLAHHIGIPESSARGALPMTSGTCTSCN